MKVKIVSSLEKVFIDESIDNYKEFKKFSCLRGERFSFQVIYSAGDEIKRLEYAKLDIESDLKKYITVKKVKNVPVEYPIFHDMYDENYLRTTPGLYPDVLVDMNYKSDDSEYGYVRCVPNTLNSIWISVDVPEKTKLSGNYTIKIKFTSELGTFVKTFTLNIIPKALPKQKLIYTEWFHYDGLASYYNVDAWSDKHFEIIKNFVKTACDNGINMLLVPVFTPPLDTEVGGERMTTQLVKISLKNGKYSFDYKLLDKFLDLISSIGIKYYEIAHLFTQWGCYHAPKIVANVDGKEKKIFGWETDAHSEEYISFLRTFLNSFISHMKKRGEDKKCFYHISDEPNEKHLESYKQGKDALYDILKDYTIMDALSNYEYYSQGIVQTPIPASDHIKPFIDNKVKNLWTYYCCGQCVGVSNRLIAMPSYRNRMIGVQMYKYDIVGFLQWGYNFYNNRFSHDHIDPYLDLSGDNWVPAGDTFSVYPGLNYNAYESIRLKVFYEGISDIRALQACEKYYSKEEIIEAIEKVYKKKITFSDCAHSASEFLKIRAKINELIANKIEENQ